MSRTEPANAGHGAEPRTQTPGTRRLLAADEITSEVLFGLIMVLTFTGAISVTSDGGAEIRTMLLGALGCNIAWGLIDAVMYLMACLNQRGRSMLVVRDLHDAAGVSERRAALAKALPEPVADVMRPEDLERMGEMLLRLPRPAGPPRFERDDWRGAMLVFLLVMGATVPVVLPFAVMHDLAAAMRVSDGIAIAMLFASGWLYGKSAGLGAWTTGAAMVLLGSVLVAVTMALGG